MKGDLKYSKQPLDTLKNQKIPDGDHDLMKIFRTSQTRD